MEELHGTGVSFEKTRWEQKNIKQMMCKIVIIVPYFICSSGQHFTLCNMPSTSDAYITGNPVIITSGTYGKVAFIAPTTNERVLKGDLLLQVDNTVEKLHYKKAEETLLETQKETKERYAADSQNNAQILNAQMIFQQALIDYNRRLQSKGPEAISKDDLQQALRNVNNSKAALDAAIKKYRQNVVLLQETDMARQKMILRAKSTLHKAAEALERTEVHSPVNGYVAQRNVHTGLKISPGKTLMTIIPADQMWINANFTVAQLSGVLIGQKALIVTETYGKKVIFDGEVEGWDQDASISVSNLNSSGKRLSGVQKIPVRISINPMQLSQYPLRIGISSKVNLIDDNSRKTVFMMVKNEIEMLRVYRKHCDGNSA